MREILTDIVISAPARKVWHVLTDFAHFPQWNPFILAAEGEVKEGARLRVHIAPPGARSMMFTPTVIRVVPEREFRWRGRLLLPGLFDGEHIFEIMSSGPNGIRFVQREEFRGVLVPLLWRRLAMPTRQGFHAMNLALKSQSEAGEP